MKNYTFVPPKVEFLCHCNCCGKDFGKIAPNSTLHKYCPTCKVDLYFDADDEGNMLLSRVPSAKAG